MSNLHIQKLITNNLLLLNIFLFVYGYCYLIIPLKYYPLYKYNNSDPSDTMQSIVSTKLYSLIDIGTPQKQIEIPLDFKSNDFYISDNPIDIFEQDEINKKLYSDIKFYNSLFSSSKVPLEDIYFDGDNFNFGEYSLESFYFNNKKYEMSFYIPLTLNSPESGGIGLLLISSSDATPDEKRTFLYILKEKLLINNYFWSIFFNQKEISNEEEGFILIGSLPDQVNSDLGYYKKDYFSNSILENVNAETSRKIILNKFQIDEILVYEGNNKNKILYDFPVNGTDIKYIELNYHSRGVQAPYILLKKYEEVFEEFISKNECFKSEFNYLGKKYFFYCKNDKEKIKQIKNIFPGFMFLIKHLNKEFYLDADDLFYEKDEYVYCLLYFHYNEYIEKNWIMGKPFLKKYQFSFNPESKYIYFYSKKDKEEKKKQISLKLMIYLIFLTIVFVSLAFFLFFKFYLYDKIKKKKRANELDDDYDYIEKKDNENDNKGNEIIINE